jgi:hypothetical protein
MPGPEPSDKVKKKYDVYAGAKKATAIGPDPEAEMWRSHWLWGPILNKTGADPSIMTPAMDLASLLSMGSDIGGGMKSSIAEMPKSFQNSLDLNVKSLSAEQIASLAHHMTPEQKAGFSESLKSGQHNEFLTKQLSQDPTLLTRAGFDGIRLPSSTASNAAEFAPDLTTYNQGQPQNSPAPDVAEGAYRNILASLPTNPGYKAMGRR